MREIITLQLGQQSSCMGTHFWNTQESYFTYSDDQKSPVDHDIHWRPGLATDGSETFLPRAVIYDLKGGFGSLRKFNALYEPTQEKATAQIWEGAPVIHKQKPISQSAFQQSLDSGVASARLVAEDVRYWSDFSRVYFHPRSLNELHDFELNSSIVPFDNWALGSQLFSTLDKEHDIIDRDFRLFVEEADQMQAIQIFGTLDDAWGGFGAGYIERLRDEYGKTPILLWGLLAATPPASRDQRRQQFANTAKSLGEISELASMLVPLAVPRLIQGIVHLDVHSAWETSALLSTGVETAGLPSRLLSQNGAHRGILEDLTTSLNLSGGQTISRLQMTISRPAGGKSQEPRIFPEVPAMQRSAADPGFNIPSLDIDFFDVARSGPTNTLRTSFNAKAIGQSWVYRGHWDSQALIDDSDGQHYARVEKQDHGHLCRRFETGIEYALLDSFPTIFKPRNEPSNPATINVVTALSTDTSISAAMRQLRTQVALYIPPEDREALGNRLAELEESYGDGWLSGSDEDDD